MRLTHKPTAEYHNHLQVGFFLLTVVCVSSWPSFLGGPAAWRRPSIARSASEIPERGGPREPVEGVEGGELPDWLMEATGGVPKEAPSGRVDFGWDYRVVSAVIFALGLLYVGIQG
ncbi:unnamed protein product [Symbiodinium necroappetens]|uniref:Uncharacterized protein n=1 Tax=Symbiodinium necroappetens TaxID=1628268 RepID=A0A812W222_9DINO|nr:unnamed protein product [Symbiodinium necroappetens]